MWSTNSLLYSNTMQSNELPFPRSLKMLWKVFSMFFGRTTHNEPEVVAFILSLGLGEMAAWANWVLSALCKQQRVW